MTMAMGMGMGMGMGMVTRPAKVLSKASQCEPVPSVVIGLRLGGLAKGLSPRYSSKTADQPLILIVGYFS